MPDELKPMLVRVAPQVRGCGGNAVVSLLRILICVVLATTGCLFADPPGIVWTDISKESARIGDVSIKLRSAIVRDTWWGPDGNGFANGRHQRISLTITNRSEAKKYDFRPWGRGTHPDARGVTVTDDLDNSYKSILLRRGLNLRLMPYPYLDDDHSLYPGKDTIDDLLYESPIAKAKTIRITLPAAAVGQKGTFHIEIPVAAIKNE